MKKILSFVLACLLILSLVPAALAEEAAEVKITSVQLNVTTPVPGSPAKLPTAADVIVKAGDETLTATTDYTVSGTWSFESMEHGKTVMSESETFVEACHYELEIEIVFLKEGCSVPDKSAFYVKEDGGAVKSAQSAGYSFPAKGSSSIKLSHGYDCNPTNLEAITPELSDILVDGILGGKDVDKEYDGKIVELSVQVVNKKANAAYAYQWKKDGRAVEGKTEEVLKLRNVSDTGVWSCDVAAYYPSNPDAKTATVTSFNKSVKITPHSIQLILEDAQKNLYDKDPAFTYTILGEAYDELQGAIERVQGETIGNYPLLLGTLSFPEDVKDNYFISVQQGSLTILEAGVTAFAPVSGILNGAEIYGDKNSNFRASATTGALPDGSHLIFNRVESDGDKNTLAQSSSKTMLKCFTVSAKDSADKAILLPSHAAIKVQIPLTSEEAASYVKNTMTVKLLVGKSVKDIEAEEVMTGEVKYLAVLLEDFGTVAVFAGEPLPTDTIGGTAVPDTPKEEENDSIWLWILIGALVLIAVGAIVFTVVWTGKNAPAAKPTTAHAPTPSRAKPASARTPAKPAPRREDCDATRKIGDGDVTIAPHPVSKERPRPTAEKAPEASPKAESVKEEAPKKDPKVFSFEDLEEE